jgi:hypothetical protein
MLIEATILVPSNEFGGALNRPWSGLGTALRDLHAREDLDPWLLTPSLTEYALEAWQSWEDRNVDTDELLGLDAISDLTVTDVILEQRGLLGPELEFKLAGFNERPRVPTYRNSGGDFERLSTLYSQPRGTEWTDLLQDASVPPLSRRSNFFRWRLRKWLEGTLEWADVGLDSLASAIPAIEPLMEIKKAVVAGLKDPQTSSEDS